jgi:hypothetical protein
MRRILSLVVVALVMAAIMLAMAMPAFATKMPILRDHDNCGHKNPFAFLTFSEGEGQGADQIHDCKPHTPTR